MAIQATDKKVFAMPPEGWQKITIKEAQRVPGFGGKGWQLLVVFVGTDDKGEARDFKRWIPIPDGSVVNSGHIYLRFGAALAGKELLAEGEVFDDDDLTSMIGKSVRAEIVHTVKGQKSANVGAPDWKFNNFQPIPAAPISEGEATEIKQAMYVLWPGTSDAEKGLRLGEGRKLVTTALGRECKVAELKPAEAKLVWRALNDAATAAGKPPFRTIVEDVAPVAATEDEV